MKLANNNHQKIQQEPESWQLTDAEIEDMTRINAEEAALNARGVTQRDWAYEMDYDQYPQDPPSKTFAVRFQQINLFRIEIEAANAEEAEQQARRVYKASTESAELLNSYFGHASIEQLK